MQCDIVQQAEAGSSQHDGVDTAGGADQLMLPVSKSFARNTLDAIACSGQLDVLFRYHDAETGVAELIGASENQ